jgi:Fe-S-cluster containining protein
VHLATGLTPEDASRICQHECRAQCCRGPLYLRLTAPEVRRFRARAAALGVELKLTEAADGTGSVVFLEHAGERCPMLDDSTSACRIYDDRPEPCRAFPDRPRRGCAISGAEGTAATDDHLS